MKQCQEKFLKLLQELEEEFPKTNARVRFEKCADNELRFIGNECGVVHWGMLVAGSAVLKDQMKPDFPEVLLVHDEELVTKDSEVRFTDWICNEDLRSEPIWPQLSKEEQRKQTISDRIGMIGCSVLIVLVVVSLIHSAGSLINWLNS